jgi:hypothetical protein
MALVFYEEVTEIFEMPARQEREEIAETEAHEETYRKFVRIFWIGAALLPLYFIFLIYMTT